MKKIKVQQNKRGIVLVTAVVVLMVLFIMGVAILAMSSNEAKLTARQYNSTQAYYAARSGAEIGLQKIDDIIMGSTEPLTDVTELYAKLAGFSGDVQTGQNFTVTYIGDGYIADDKIKILSQGSDQGVTETTAITLYVNNPNFDMSGWINPAGLIRKGAKERAEAPVVVKVGKTVGTSPKKETSNETSWTSPAIHFLDNAGGYSFEITAKTMTFNTQILSFQHKVYIKKVNDDNFVVNRFKTEELLDESGNELVLNTEGDTIDRTWSVVVFYEDLVKGKNNNPTDVVLASGHYAVASGINMSNESDLADATKIQKITNTDTIKYIDDIIKRNTSLQVDLDNIVWSEK